MTVDTMSVTVSLLTSAGFHATVEYPGTINVMTGESELFVFGTANPMFGCDIYKTYRDDTSSPDDSMDTDISSECNDPVLIAETIAKTIYPEGDHRFQCALCRDILNPGDHVVWYQDAETNIDVFCSDACKYEENPMIEDVAKELKHRGFDAKPESGYITVFKYGLRFTFENDETWQGEVEADRSSGIVSVDVPADSTDISRIADALVKAMKSCAPGVTTPELPAESSWVFINVVKEMDKAENLFGPQDINEYVSLMKAITAEANQRIVNAEAWTKDFPA